MIAVATDRDIGLGDDWHARIQADLNRAGAAVLLVSLAFLASEYIRNNELPVLLPRAKTQGLRIVPVILRPCLYAETSFKYPDPKTGPEDSPWPRSRPPAHPPRP
ncbi:MAG: TIR domain-containing protein [Gammaproteobacteria bacterium]